MTQDLQIPGIELREELGHGAHSVVHRAMQGGTACAVKVLRTKGRWSAWVYREAVALARVRHPGLPVVLEVGEVEDGLPYLVMELVEGETLAERLRRGPLDRRAALDLARHVALSLAVVHEAGLVHRDVRPANLVVERSGRVRLVDFGFATPMERTEGDGGAAAKYAAPEQLRRPSRIDGRSDLFALGRVLHECTTGVLPAGGPDVRMLATMVGEDAAGVIAGLLAPAPEGRYPDARAFLADLARLEVGERPRLPVRARATPRQGRLVGRDAELEVALRPMSALDGGRGALVFVRGASGAGKTALLSACSAVLRTGHIVVEVRCRDGAAPLAALRSVFDHLLDAIARRAPVERDEAERQLSALATNLEPLAVLVAPRLAPLLRARPAAAPSPEACLEGAAELILRLATAMGPLVILFDDVHWMDRVSRDVLVRVAHRLEEARLGLVLAARTGTDDGGWQDANVRGSTIELRPLAENEIEQLVGNYLGGAGVPGLAARVAALADGTPLGVIEVLGGFLDEGALRPKSGGWAFDPTRAARVRWPSGAGALLDRRVHDLDEETRSVLLVAAVLGPRFEDEALARALSRSPDDLAFALGEARRAGVLELAGAGHHQFLHDGLRELFLRNASASEARDWHGRIAEILDTGEADGDRLHRVARHYESGEVERSPLRAFHATFKAANSALGRFDNEAAVALLDFARRAATLAALGLDAEFYLALGEAKVGLGALEEGLRAFEAALGRVRDDVTRATILARIARVHRVRGEAALAWERLGQAFTAVHERMPAEGVTTVAHAAGRMARYGLRAIAKTRSREDGAERALLCELHLQNARLGLENDKPLRSLQSALEMRELAEALGPSSALARAEAAYGLAATLLSKGRVGAASLERGIRIAEELADRACVAFCVRQQAVASSHGGDFDGALRWFRRGIDDHGTWLELDELLLDVSSAECIEFLRGRSSRALPWVWRALDRLRRSPHIDASRYSAFLFRVRAALAAVGRDPEPWVSDRLRPIEADGGPIDASERTRSWGPRARMFVETGDVGPDFEALVRAFEGEGQRVKAVSPAAVEVCVAVVHGRIHQRFSSPDRRFDLRPLAAATRDLRAIASVPLLEAHASYAEGCIAFFEGDRARARAAWSKAESLATEETCPWVLYGVARARAHMLRETGNTEASLEQARFAQLIANEHGAVHRERFVREEFGIPSPSPVENEERSSRSSRRARRQLAALLDVARLPRSSLDPAGQADAIVDELLRHLDADQALLTFEPWSGGAPLRVARTSSGAPWRDRDGWRDALALAVRAAAEPWPVDDDPAWRRRAPDADADRTLAAPLFLHDACVGTLLVERGVSAPPFSPEDRLLVEVLSQQVPVALELARLLTEQERVRASLERGQKLQSMGHLAGGLAHDFNNVLNAIQGSASVLRDEVPGELLEDVDIILDATERAAKLTRQLLSFSHQEPGRVEACDANALLRGLEPMLRRVLGPHVPFALKTDTNVSAILTDPSSFEQALVNLVLNARDAMSETGGKITISLSNRVLDADTGRGDAPPLGDVVAVSVSDTGTGMSPDVLGRLFEPFFTTKMKRGSGLGLATVYAFVQNCGGHIEVSSEVGQGTTFTLFFKRAPEAMIVRGVARPATATDPSTILLVDEDDSLRKSTRRLLEFHGYHVLDASTADEAYGIVQRYRKEIGLLIVDVIMPDGSGPDIARSIREMDTPAKILFVSGLPPKGTEPVEDLGGQPLLEKPFSASDLLSTIASLLPPRLTQDQA